MDNIIIQDNEIRKTLKRAQEITLYDYSDGSLGAIVTALQDMIIAYTDLEIEFDDYRAETEEHTRPLPIAEEIGAAAYRGR